MEFTDSEKNKIFQEERFHDFQFFDSYVFCDVCYCCFTVGYFGIQAIKDHAEGTKHLDNKARLLLMKESENVEIDMRELEVPMMAEVPENEDLPDEENSAANHSNVTNSNLFPMNSDENSIYASFHVYENYVKESSIVEEPLDKKSEKKSHDNIEVFPAEKENKDHRKSQIKPKKVDANPVLKKLACCRKPKLLSKNNPIKRKHAGENAHIPASLSSIQTTFDSKEDKSSEPQRLDSNDLVSENDFPVSFGRKNPLNTEDLNVGVNNYLRNLHERKLAFETDCHKILIGFENLLNKARTSEFDYIDGIYKKYFPCEAPNKAGFIKLLMALSNNNPDFLKPNTSFGPKN